MVVASKRGSCRKYFQNYLETEKEKNTERGTESRNAKDRYHGNMKRKLKVEVNNTDNKG